MIEKLILRPLCRDDQESFLSAVHRFSADESDLEFAFDFEEQQDFADYVQKLEHWSEGFDLPEKFVPNTYLVGVIDNEIVGRVSIRHRLNTFLERIGGHVGYAVVPDHRMKGYATQMLKLTIPVCSSLGIPSVLITCDTDNVASRKVIENCGGVFEGVTDCAELTVQKRRYWIKTDSN